MPEVSTQYMDFKYLPTSGELPGSSFEEQTVAIINEIGNVAYTALNAINEQESAAQTFAATPSAQSVAVDYVSQIAGLQAEIDALKERVTALEAAAGSTATPGIEEWQMS